MCSRRWSPDSNVLTVDIWAFSHRGNFVYRRSRNQCHVSVAWRRSPSGWQVASYVLLEGTTATKSLGPITPTGLGDWSWRNGWDAMKSHLLTVPIFRTAISICFDPLRNIWLRSHLQKTPTWSKPSPPGYSSLTMIICQNASFSSTEEHTINPYPANAENMVSSYQC